MLHFGREALEHALEQGEGPLAIEEGLGGEVVGCQFTEPVLSVDRNETPPTAALLALLPVTLVGQEILARRQQERPQPSLAAVDHIENAFLDQPGEERLGEVLGRVRRMPSATNEGVEREPVC